MNSYIIQEKTNVIGGNILSTRRNFSMALMDLDGPDVVAEWMDQRHKYIAIVLG